MKKCKDCLSEIEEKAKKCPKCGTDQKNWFARHPIITSIVSLFLILIIVNPAGSLEDTTQPKVNNVTQSSEKAVNEKSPETKKWYEVQTLSGKGNQETASFTISGNKIKITATTSGGSAGIGTYSGIGLESENGGYLGAGLSISTEGAEDGHGETTYRNLKSGEYYISVITGVNWEVKVEEYR